MATLMARAMTTALPMGTAVVVIVMATERKRKKEFLRETSMAMRMESESGWWTKTETQFE
jgi:hypothetical protein